MYMTLSQTHDLAKHMTTGGAQSGSVTLPPPFKHGTPATLIFAAQHIQYWLPTFWRLKARMWP